MATRERSEGHPRLTTGVVRDGVPSDAGLASGFAFGVRLDHPSDDILSCVVVSGDARLLVVLEAVRQLPVRGAFGLLENEIGHPRP